ncbi:MAG TPA: F0F1 ATP synthase subunit epsilon [Rhizomicrobium sp.]|jgi:F-type H+-transporting ATPase subunit epsilon|nr:F0F1 ATP synthase subunit epsilon [Rhizomicrobium sp.]
MVQKITFDLVSPERLLLSQAVDMVTIPGSEGYMGVAAGHMPLVSTLRAGMINMLDNGTETRFFIMGGFAEINASQVIVLAEEALPMSELDLAVLDQRIKDAQDDEIAAKTDADRVKAALRVDDLKLVRAVF